MSPRGSEKLSHILETLITKGQRDNEGEEC